MNERQVQIGNYIFLVRRNDNGTYYSEPLTKLKEEAGIPLPAIQKERILAKFESSSTPGTWHYVIQSPQSEIYCTCWGFSRHRKCWHYELVMEIGPDKACGLVMEGKTDGQSKI